MACCCFAQWLFKLLAVACALASNLQIVVIITSCAAQLQVLMWTLGDAAMPERFEGMPLTDVLLVNIKLLTLTELKLITEKGTEGRRRLNELFSGAPRLVSSAKRGAVH